MERSTAKVACGFAFQLLLYALYVLAGVAVVAIATPSAAEGGPSQLCTVNIKVYSSVGVLAALRAVMQLCLSFHKYLRRRPTFPTVRELWVRVGIKALVAAYGLALFGAFRRHGELLALQRTAYPLWCFFGITLWTNVISVALVPFNFKESLTAARRIQEEQDAEAAGTRPLSSQHSHHQHPSSGRYANFAQRSISSGYHVESPEDARRTGGGGGGGKGGRASEQSEEGVGGGEDEDPYAAAARFA